jgi:hypothetical protein
VDRDPWNPTSAPLLHNKRERRRRAGAVLTVDDYVAGAFCIESVSVAGSSYGSITERIIRVGSEYFRRNPLMQSRCPKRLSIAQTNLKSLSGSTPHQSHRSADSRLRCRQKAPERHLPHHRGTMYRQRYRLLLPAICRTRENSPENL